jgi:hypothetical protein
MVFSMSVESNPEMAADMPFPPLWGVGKADSKVLGSWSLAFATHFVLLNNRLLRKTGGCYEKREKRD